MTGIFTNQYNLFSFFIYFHIYFFIFSFVSIRDFSSFGFDYIFSNHNVSRKISKIIESWQLKSNLRENLFSILYQFVILIRNFDSIIYFWIIKFVKKIYKFKKLLDKRKLFFTLSIMQSYLFIHIHILFYYIIFYFYYIYLYSYSYFFIYFQFISNFVSIRDSRFIRITHFRTTSIFSKSKKKKLLDDREALIFTKSNSSLRKPGSSRSASH